MKLVILESPYAGDIEANVEYARACVRDSLSRGEAPIASHLLYTQPGILRDEVPEERQWGIDAGLAWGNKAEATVLYVDRGISRGMEYGIANAEKVGRPVERRSIQGWRPETMVDRSSIEAQIAKFQQALDDPWRPIKNAQNGCDPIITEAETRQLRCAIAELSSQLSSKERQSD